MRRFLLIAVYTGLLLAGCDSSFVRPELDTPETLAATSILAPHLDQNVVLLTNVANPLPDRQNAKLIQNATVRVGGGTFDNRTAPDTLTTSNRLLRRANYRTRALDVEPGKTYPLEVEKGEHSLTGTVTVPDTFSIRANGHRLHWTESEGAGRYLVHVEAAEGAHFSFLREYTVTDTTVLVQDDDFTPGSYSIEITAQDPNLTAFMRDETDRAGIQGGYGLFGALTLVADTLELPAP